VEGLEARALLALSGVLDPAFADSGVFTLPSDSGTVGLGTIVTQTNGSVVAAGKDGVIRLTGNGTLDPTFGTGGKSSPTLPSGFSVSSLDKLVIAPDGKIVLMGVMFSGSGSSKVAQSFVARLNSNGTPDASFGSNGTVVVGSSANAAGQTMPGISGSIEPNAGFRSFAVQADNELVLAGFVPLSATNTNTEIAAIRLKVDGALDTSFGSDGLVTISNGSGHPEFFEMAADVAIAPNGQIILAGGLSFNDLTSPLLAHQGEIFRLNPDGSRDNSLLSTGLGGVDAQKVALQPDGEFLVLGNSFLAVGSSFQEEFTNVVRLDTGGALETTATLPGEVEGRSQLALQSLSLLADDKVVLAGNSGVIRLTADLVPDLTFGTVGAARPFRNVSIVTGGATEIFAGAVSAAAIAPNGKILTVGSGSLTSSLNGTSSGVAFVSQITSTGFGQAVPGDYTGDGVSDPAVYLPNLGDYAIRPSSGGTDQLIPFGIPGTGQYIPAPADYTGSGVTEIAAYLPGPGLYAYRPAGGGGDVAVSFGIPGAGQTIPAPGDYEGTGQDDIAVYLPSLGAFGIRSSTGGTDQIIPFGIPGAGQSIPAPADYFGTGRDDIAVYLPAMGAFAIRPPSGTDQIIPFGMAGLGNSIPIPGDYDGSGKVELAVYMPTIGEFAYRPANGGPDVLQAFGVAGDGSLPVPGDYTGAGHDEIAVYDQAQGSLAYRRAGTLSDVVIHFGSAGAGQSVPAAAPPGALPEFAAVSATSARAGVSAASVPRSPSPSVTSRGVGVTSGSAVPSGPDLSARRAALVPVNQDRSDPWSMG
jgi:uncharacterized delta-60 repeat protein